MFATPSIFIGSSNMVVIWALVQIYFGIVVNCIMTFLLYIQLFKENATFKIHFVLIVLPCKQQNVTYIRFLNYMHLSLKRTSSHKIHTLLIIYGIIKTLKQKRTYDPQLRTIAVALYRIASLLCTCLLHTFS